MSKIRYACIDDTSDSSIKSIIKRFESDELEIDLIHVDKLLDKNYIINRLVEYNGILMDLRTDENGSNSQFMGTSWGQHLRDMITEGSLKRDFPIVLFSTDNKLETIYFKDTTSNNIFDRYLSKDNKNENSKETKKLISLANGYKIISENKSFDNLLQDNLSMIDTAIYSKFIDTNYPIHEYAQVILKDIIYPIGLLIDENYLLARLGIDRESSDIDKIKDIFKEAKYSGVFSDGWDRWWMYRVQNIFREITGENILFINAEERVKLLIEKLGLSLKFAEPIYDDKISNYKYSLDYWSVCKELNRPIDTEDGYRIQMKYEPKPYQEYEYVSKKAMLTDKSKYKVHKLDLDLYYEDMKALND